MSAGPGGDGAELSQWFERYDDDSEVPFSAAGVAFLAGLRARAVARRWPCHPGETASLLEYRNGLLEVLLFLSDEETRRGLITFGLIFDGQRIVGDRVHDQVFDFEEPSEAAIEFSGSLDSLVERAGEWFEWLLTWPIERREWFKRGKLLYHEWVVAHTNKKLWVNASRPPKGEPDRVVLVRGQAGGPAPAPWLSA